jgi:PTS system ascorbate-specific IIA component
MSTEIILITQKHVGTALIKAAKNIFGKLPLKVTAVSVNYRVNPDSLVHKLQNTLDHLSADKEVLILTDLYGSTPSNIANRLGAQCRNHVNVITGLNLPMLIKVLDHASLPLKNLAEYAIQGGRQGVFDCKISQKEA